ncbi:siderophore-interacting protein [Leucobacter luti]|uniref:NADPH-dependent ferric siderophore reductase n=1 Tax=Leucobacter luti TaxID=340320 RepID=A0A4R6RZ79_9MICO|nr:siderophore-interacting protein [Leucobacter luti]QYM76215.1 siderophore-interacting protein [Leucobacter luti]TDP92482.1 NADPH-dependent ferric siderophore reductase [Leucobacter luti]
MPAPQGAGSGRPVRPVRPQIVLEVRERIQLSPHLVRIVAGGPGFAALEATPHTDAYSKMLFTPPGSQLTPPYDLDALRAALPPEQLPSTRTYTVRRIDTVRSELWIEFVTHGSDGIAGPWAERAEIGDSVVLRGIGGGYAPDPTADWHLLAGDESALPAIASALEAMPSDARGVALIEVGSETDRLELRVPDGVELRWLFRGADEAGTSSVLVDAVRGAEWGPGRAQVFVHGERGAMKLLRPYFTEERGIERAQLSLSPYWAYGRREDAFQAEKREPVGQI